MELCAGNRGPDVNWTGHRTAAPCLRSFHRPKLISIQRVQNVSTIRMLDFFDSVGDSAGNASRLAGFSGIAASI